MLVNNLCCDPVCLSKIFSTNKEGLLKKNYSDKAKALSVVLPFVQNGVLRDSTYKLEAVQSVQYQDVTRFELLYHIINSYKGSYIPKRAIVDYEIKTNQPIFVDWTEVKWEGKYWRVEVDKVDSAHTSKIIGQFSSLYSEVAQEKSFSVDEYDLNKVDQYRVIFKNNITHQRSSRILYKHEGKIIILKEEVKEISDCKSYRNKYENFTALTNAARGNGQLGSAVIFAKELDIFQGCDIEKVVEWAKNCKLVDYRFHGENSTHTITVVLQFITNTNQYHLVSEKAHEKRPESPVPVDIPTSNDKIEEDEGQEAEIITCGGMENPKTNSIIKTIVEYMNTFEGSVPPAKEEEFSLINQLLETQPEQIYLDGNCKFKEITLLFKNEGSYYFVYFLQEKKTQKLSYVGYTQSDENVDQTKKGDAAYEPEEFVKAFGFRPSFSRTSVKKVTLRENSIFRRKTLRVVHESHKVDKYFMYFKVDGNNYEKMFSCVCKVNKGKSTSEKWNDILGFEGHSSTDITKVT